MAVVGSFGRVGWHQHLVLNLHSSLALVSCLTRARKLLLTLLHQHVAASMCPVAMMLRRRSRRRGKDVRDGFEAVFIANALVLERNARLSVYLSASRC